MPQSFRGDRVRLLRAWLLFAVSALGIAGGFAFLAVLTRTPAIQILHTAEALHRAIAGHVTFSLLVWLLAFEAVLWILADERAADDSPLWWGLGLATFGSGLLAVAILFGNGAAILTDYVSVVVDPLFFAGLGTLAAGVGLVACRGARGAAVGGGLLGHGMRCAAAVAGLAAVAWLLALLRLDGPGAAALDFAYFQGLFWVPGHLLQFVNVAAMVSAWYLLLESGFGVAARDGRLARSAFLAYPALAGVLLAVTALVDPRDLPASLPLSVLMGAAVALPTIVHVGVVARTLRRGRPTWGSAEAPALICSLGLFTGGVFLAVARAGSGSSMWVPAHYHAVVVGGVTIAFMGLTHRLLSTTGRVAWPRLAALQPWLYGLGMLLMVVGMNWAGSAGAPRKTFDPALGDAAVRWVTPMNLMGVGGVVAVLGGASFVWNALCSLLAPRRVVLAASPAAIDPASPGLETSR